MMRKGNKTILYIHWISNKLSAIFCLSVIIYIDSVMTYSAMHNTNLLYPPCIFKSLHAPTGIFAIVPSVVRFVPCEMISTHGLAERPTSSKIFSLVKMAVCDFMAVLIVN